MSMGIVEQFGKRRRETEATLPSRPPITPPSAPHEKTAQALVFVTQLQEEVNFLREDNARLRADLNLATMRNRDLESERESMRFNLEAYRRYAVSIKGNLQIAMDCIRNANNEAIEAGEQSDQQHAEVISNVEREVRDMATSEIAAKYGPKEDEQH